LIGTRVGGVPQWRQAPPRRRRVPAAPFPRRL